MFIINGLRLFLKIIVVLLPWFLKRHVLRAVYGYEIHPKAYIGFSWLFPKALFMGQGARIGHLNVFVNLSEVWLDESAGIGRSNWITGHPISSMRHFTHVKSRNPRLYLGRHSAITKQHHIDCTDSILIGEYTTIAGYRSQFLTHSLNLETCRQDCRPITIGAYCFVGTDVVVLGGSKLADYSVLGAKSLLNGRFEDSYSLVAGVPAKKIKSLDSSLLYFKRESGYVS